MALAKVAEPAPIHPKRFLQRHNVFVRRARDAAHQSLFFLGLLETSTRPQANEAVAEYRPFALDQVKSLVRTVHLPEGYHLLERQLADRSPHLEAKRRELERAVDLFHQWRSIFDHLENAHSADPESLGRSLAAFLDGSRAERWLERLHTHWLPDLINYLRKNLSQLWATFLVLVVALGIEAVNSLLRNEGTTTLIPLSLLVVPLLARRFLHVIVRATRGAAPAWDLGGPPFRSFRRQALEPGRMIHRWPSGHRRLIQEVFRGQVILLAAQAVWWLVAATVLWSLLWIGVLSGSSLTVFLLLSHFYLVLVLARALDFWDYLDPRPVRFVLLLGAMILLLAMLAGMGREMMMVVFAVAAVAYPLLSRRNKGFRSVVAVCLLVPVATGLAGKRTLDKDVWRDTGAGWQRLGPGEWPWPAPPGSKAPPVVVLAASGGGSRAAVYTGLTLMHLQQDQPGIAEQLQAISSVSGGSLANASYVARLLETPIHADPGTRWARRTAAIADLHEAMQEDFLLPTLQGALLFGRTRGSAIESDWRTGPAGLHGYHLSDLARHWRRDRKNGAPVPPFPLPLFNSSTLDAHDVVISPLSRKLYTRDGLDDEAWDLQRNAYAQLSDDDLPTWVYYRDGVYGLEDLLPRFDPPLSSAVRASANFPFGFPLVRVETKQPLFFSPLAADRRPDTIKDVRLTDGGALSNSGMWSLFNLLMQKDNLKALRERGVLLLIVEASRMPTYRSVDKALNSLLGTIEDQSPVGQRLHREMLEILGMAYGDRIAVVQLDLLPQERYNVFTTWALDRRSLDRLHSSFDERWKAELPNLVKSWNQLAQGAPAGKPYIDRRRPPLD